MMASLVARGMALAFLVLAAAAAAGLWAHWGEPGLRSVARGIFAIVLVELAMVAWRWPKQRPRRFRDRTTRLLAVMATPSLHADYAESSPQVSLPVAFLDDWALLRAERAALPPGSLSPAEEAALDDLDHVVEHLRPALLALGLLPPAELPEHEAWRLLVAAAERARVAWLAATA